MKRGLLGRMRVIDGREAGGVVCDCAHDHAESITNKVARPAFRRSRAGEGSFADCVASSIIHLWMAVQASYPRIKWMINVCMA